MLYRILKAIVWVGIRFYYRETRVVNKHYLDQEGPVIIIANHPNTLMDAWMMGYINKRRVHFMAKATFFNSPFKRKVLSALGMIPINRKADGATSGVSNKDSFEACYQLLERGEVLVVFPEGTSYLERKLREIKSGTARIALEAERRNGGKLGLRVIPVGLNYVSADSFRGRVMAHVGKPIAMDDLWKEFELNQGAAAKKLTERFRVELTRVFVSMDNEVKEGLGEQLSWLFDTRYAREREGVSSSISLLKEVNEKLDEFAVSSPWKIQEIEQETGRLIGQLQAYRIRPDFLDRPFRSRLYARQFLQSVFFLIITVPFFIFGFVHNVLPYLLIGKLVPRLSKEVEYHAPLAVLLGLVLYPLNYLLLALIGKHLFDLGWLWTIIYFSAMPVIGMFAHFFLRYIKHLHSKQRFSRFAKRRSLVFQQLKEAREDLKRLIFSD